MARKPKSIPIDLTELSANQQRQVYSKYAKLANARMRSLEQQGIDYFAYARAKKDLGGLTRFPTSTKNISNTRLANLVASVQTFINSKSSTISGLTAINESRIDTFRQKFLISEAKGYIELDTIQLRSSDGTLYTPTSTQFREFLYSNEFSEGLTDFLETTRDKGLSQYGDSDTVIEQAALALFERSSIEDIINSFNQSNAQNIPFDEVQELRRSTSFNLR